jgi:hypothetical protein
MKVDWQSAGYGAAAVALLWWLMRKGCPCAAASSTTETSKIAEPAPTATAIYSGASEGMPPMMSSCPDGAC